MSNVVNVATPETSLSVRFVSRVMTELNGNVELKFSDDQKRMAQGYYMACDRALKAAEERRTGDGLPYTWANTVIDTELGQNIATYIRFGIDASLPNTLYFVPKFDSKKKKYRFNFMLGHEGRKLIAKKYAYDEIIDIRDELVYSNDKFEIIKKSSSQDVENYKFEITNPFDRGDLVGGFVYVEYKDSSKNFVFVMSKAEIDKHKSKAATHAIWNAWYDLMARKTIIHAACKRISIDPKKIDDNYKRMLEDDVDGAVLSAQETIDVQANTGEIIDIEAAANQELPTPQAEPVANETEEAPAIKSEEEPF